MSERRDGAGAGARDAAASAPRGGGSGALKARLRGVGAEEGAALLEPPPDAAAAKPVAAKAPAKAGPQAPAGAAAEAPAPLQLGAFTVATYADWAAWIRHVTREIGLSLDGLPSYSKAAREAREWADGLSFYLPEFDKKGTEPLGASAQTMAKSYHDELDRIWRAVEDEKRAIAKEAESDDIIAAARVAEEQAAALREREPQLADELRERFLAGDTSALGDTAGVVKACGETATGLAALGMAIRGSASAAASGMGMKDVAASLAAPLYKTFKVAKLIVDWKPMSNARTEYDAAAGQLENVLSTMGAASSFLQVSPALSGFMLTYVGPMTKMITKQLAKILTQKRHDINTALLAIGHAPPMAGEPGGADMFDFMVPVMNAGSASELPKASKTVREYLLSKRELFGAGTRRDVPTTGTVWKDLDDAKLGGWIFAHRDEVWKMLYGSWPVPDPSVRAAK